MVQNPKITLDEMLEGFKKESARLLRLKKKEYNVAVIGCGDVGQEIIKQLVCDDRVANLVISNKHSKKEAKWVADVTNTIDMPYEKMGSWLGGFEKDGKDIDLDVVIMTAGPFEMNRAKGLIENAKAMDEFATAAKDAKYKGLTKIVSNPVAALCFQYAVTTGNDPYSIIGFNPDPNRATKRLFAYLKENHVEELRSNDASEEELRKEQEFVDSLQDERDIQGFRLVGAHTSYSESEKDGEKVPCRLGIWKEATVKGRKISELGTFREISRLVPEWIIEEHGKEHVKTEKGEHKGSPRHAIVMKEHFFPMIDGEVEGMGPIVFDAKRGIWAARPANFMFHRVQPLSDKDAGIVGEVREGYDDVCNYYIRKDCIDELVANGLVNKDEAARYVEFARSVRPPEDKEKRFGQRALRFIREREKDIDEILESSGLSDGEKAEYRKRFEEEKKAFLGKAGLFDLGSLYAISDDQVIKYELHNFDGEDISSENFQTSEIENLKGVIDVSDDRVCVLSNVRHHSRVENYLKVFKDGKRIWATDEVKHHIKGVRLYGDYAYVGLEAKSGDIKIVELDLRKRLVGKRELEGIVNGTKPIGSTLITFDIAEIDSKPCIFFATEKNEIMYCGLDRSNPTKFADTDGTMRKLRVLSNEGIILGSKSGKAYLWDQSDSEKKPRQFDIQSQKVDVDSYDGQIRVLYIKDNKLKLKSFSRTGLFSGREVEPKVYSDFESSEVCWLKLSGDYIILASICEDGANLKVLDKNLSHVGNLNIADEYIDLGNDSLIFERQGELNG
jgi:WD40 repeat protein